MKVWLTITSDFVQIDEAKYTGLDFTLYVRANTANDAPIWKTLEIKEKCGR